MEYLFIYLLQMADNLFVLQGFIYILLFISIFAWIFAYMMLDTVSYYNDEKSTRKKRLIRSIKKFYITCISILIIASLIPTKQTLLLVGGTYMGKKAINTVITSEKLKKVDTIINLELDKRIKELKGEQNEI